MFYEEANIYYNHLFFEPHKHFKDRNEVRMIFGFVAVMVVGTKKKTHPPSSSLKTAGLVKYAWL